MRNKKIARPTNKRRAIGHTTCLMFPEKSYLLSAEDIHKALHYGFGMKESMVGVAQIRNDEVVLSGPKIKNISNYHSFEFTEKKMKMWKYFDIGDGIEQDYSDSSIKPAIELLLPYSKTESNVQRYQSGKQKKKRDDRQLCTLQFCPEVNCTASFESSSELEEHMLSGLHNVANSTSWLD